MLDDLPLPIKVNFSIKPKYAFLVGVTQIVYARFESTIVDIIGFHKKGFRHGYYLRDQLNPSDLLHDLDEIGKPEDRAAIASIRVGFQKAVYLRNAMDHSVTCGGRDNYDVLLFQTGLQKRGRRTPLENRNPYRTIYIPHSSAYPDLSGFFVVLGRHNSA